MDTIDTNTQAAIDDFLQGFIGTTFDVIDKVASGLFTPATGIALARRFEEELMAYVNGLNLVERKNSEISPLMTIAWSRLVTLLKVSVLAAGLRPVDGLILGGFAEDLVTIDKAADFAAKLIADAAVASK